MTRRLESAISKSVRNIKPSSKHESVQFTWCELLIWFLSVGTNWISTSPRLRNPLLQRSLCFITDVTMRLQLAGTLERMQDVVYFSINSICVSAGFLYWKLLTAQVEPPLILHQLNGFNATIKSPLWVKGNRRMNHTKGEIIPSFFKNNRRKAESVLIELSEMERRSDIMQDKQVLFRIVRQTKCHQCSKIKQYS